MPLRVAILATDPAESHGWSRHTQDLIAALADQDVSITLITTAGATYQPPAHVESVYRILPSLTPPGRFTPLRIAALAPRLRQITAGYAAVHVIAEPYTLAAWGNPAPLIVTAHGTYLPTTAKSRGWGWLYRRLYRRARIACVSAYTQGRVLAAVPNLQTKVIPNGVVLSRFGEAFHRREGLTLPEKRGPIVLAVGQIKPRKGYHVLVAALPPIRAAYPDVQVAIVGNPQTDPAYTATLRAALEANGCADSVVWTGRLSDGPLLGWYAAADVFALPAINDGDRFEGFGLVYLEASAAGLPVVGTSGNGAESAIQDGVTGRLVPQNDPAALAEAVIALLSDPTRRAQMGRAGRTFAATHTWERHAAQIAAWYRA